MIAYRIDVQDKVRRLGKAPRQDDLDVVERLREALVGLMRQLQEFQFLAAIPLVSLPPGSTMANESEFDDFADAFMVPPEDLTVADNNLNEPIPIERQTIPLPSNGNISLDLQQLEIAARLKIADQQLERLRDLIAEMSFQYSHVIRPAPRKSMRLRGHAKVCSLHHEVIHHARIYSRCRSSLIKMDCDPIVLAQYPALTKIDLQASTAILNPNTPGSSNVQLSWLWYTGRNRSMAFAAGMPFPADAAATATQDVILECKYTISC